MHVREWDREHDHERDHGRGQEHDEALHAPRATERGEAADTPHLYRAAAAGRPDVVGAAWA